MDNEFKNFNNYCWYENLGPSTELIYNTIKPIYLKKYINWFFKDEEFEINLMSIIKFNIPERKPGYYGSWKGFGLYGISNKLNNAIINDIEYYISKKRAKIKALRVLNEKFTDTVIHYLYKPNGLRYNAIKNHFNSIMKTQQCRKRIN